jgi:hypothetical protein
VGFIILSNDRLPEAPKRCAASCSAYCGDSDTLGVARESFNAGMPQQVGVALMPRERRGGLGSLVCDQLAKMAT